MDVLVHHLSSISTLSIQSSSAFHLQRTRFELVVERKLRRRQLTEDGNVEITGRDLREKTHPVGRRNLFEAVRSIA
jgi:hypothetical protein